MGEEVASWVRLMGSREASSGFDNHDEVEQGHSLNEKQAHVVDILHLQVGRLDAYREQRDRLDGSGALREGEDRLIAPPTLRTIFMGTAGTDKTVVMNIIVRAIGVKIFVLLAPTG